MNEVIKAYINTYVKENGNEEITGAILNSTLNKMVSQLYAHRCYGVITPSLPLLYADDIPAWGIASQNGTYTNYGGIEVSDELALIVYDGGTFTKQTIISKAWMNNLVNDLNNKLIGTATIGYNSTLDVVEIKYANGTTLQIGREQVSFVYNSTGSTIPNGTPVYYSGVGGSGVQMPAIAPADASNLATAMVKGHATIDIPANSYGIIVCKGEMTVESHGLTVGSKIYLGVGGGYVTTPPSNPNLTIELGIVLDADTLHVYPCIISTIFHTDLSNLNSDANFLHVTSGQITAWNNKVDGPASSVNNTVPVFDGVTGKLLKGTSVTVVGNNMKPQLVTFKTPSELTGTNAMDFNLNQNWIVYLSGATTTITMTPITASPVFTCNIEVVQDAIGGRDLVLVDVDGKAVVNTQKFDFTSGGANQRCFITIKYWVTGYRFLVDNYI